MTKNKKKKRTAQIAKAIWSQKIAVTLKPYVIDKLPRI